MYPSLFSRKPFSIPAAHRNRKQNNVTTCEEDAFQGIFHHFRYGPSDNQMVGLNAQGVKAIRTHESESIHDRSSLRSNRGRIWEGFRLVLVVHLSPERGRHVQVIEIQDSYKKVVLSSGQ